MTIANNISALTSQLPDSVTLLAVSKTHPVSAIEAAYQSGLRNFGENYLQDAIEKITMLKDLNITWHFIGHIQSNKTKAVAEHFDWVHTVDSEKIAKRLSEQRPQNLPPLNILIEVNIDNEDSKAGVTLDNLPVLVNYILQLPKLNLCGLMTIPKARDNFEQQCKPFKQLKQTLTELQTQFPTANLNNLSMGMSNDFQAAIAEGATIVRIGSAIFGPRGKK